MCDQRPLITVSLVAARTRSEVLRPQAMTHVHATGRTPRLHDDPVHVKTQV
jgi:hypothetical protein